MKEQLPTYGPSPAPAAKELPWMSDSYPPHLIAQTRPDWTHSHAAAAVTGLRSSTAQLAGPQPGVGGREGTFRDAATPPAI